MITLCFLALASTKHPSCTVLQQLYQSQQSDGKSCCDGTLSFGDVQCQHDTSGYTAMYLDGQSEDEGINEGGTNTLWGANPVPWSPRPVQNAQDRYQPKHDATQLTFENFDRMKPFRATPYPGAGNGPGLMANFPPMDDGHIYIMVETGKKVAQSAADHYSLSDFAIIDGGIGGLHHSSDIAGDYLDAGILLKLNRWSLKIDASVRIQDVLPNIGGLPHHLYMASAQVVNGFLYAVTYGTRGHSVPNVITKWDTSDLSLVWFKDLRSSFSRPNTYNTGMDFRHFVVADGNIYISGTAWQSYVGKEKNPSLPNYVSDWQLRKLRPGWYEDSGRVFAIQDAETQAAMNSNDIQWTWSASPDVLRKRSPRIQFCCRRRLQFTPICAMVSRSKR